MVDWASNEPDQLPATFPTIAKLIDEAEADVLAFM
jgi:hypothetical protein